MSHAVTSAAHSGDPIDYLHPDLPASLGRVTIPVVDATTENLRGFGELVRDRASRAIEIVRWPAQGWRPVDADTGDQGGTTEGVFVTERQRDPLCRNNQAAAA